MTRTINPFSVSCVRPGALRFLFDSDASAENVIAALRSTNWRGEIVGPHGSGKSTLLCSLIPLIEQHSRVVELHTLHLGQRRLNADTASWGDHTQLIIDGYEQLSWRERWRIGIAARRRRVGLLVTAHRRMGLPLLFETRVTPQLAERVVRELLQGQDMTIASQDVNEALKVHNGNFREALFALYDLYEQQR